MRYACGCPRFLGFGKIRKIYMQWYIYICAIYIYICNESKNVRTTKTCGKMRHPIVPRGAVTCAGAIRLSYQVVVLILTVFINQSIQQLGRITTCSLWHLPWITVWVLAAHYSNPTGSYQITQTHMAGRPSVDFIQVNCHHMAHVTKRDVLLTPPHAESQTCIHTVYQHTQYYNTLLNSIAI